MKPSSRCRFASWGAFPALLLISGCMATTGGTLDLQKGLDDIQTQLWKVQKDTAALGDKVDQLRDARPEPVMIQDVPQESASRMDAIQNDLQILSRRLDEMNFRLDTIIQEIRLTRNQPPVPGPMDPEGGDSPFSLSPQPPAGGPTGTTVGTHPEELYHNAYADYSKGNYQLAVLGFEEYVRRFPESELADNAQYWVGESYFSSGEFPKAIGAFDELIQRYPYGDRLSGAHLKKGLSYLEENQTPQGVLELQYVIENFPQSDESRLARDHLIRLGLAQP